MSTERLSFIMRKIQAKHYTETLVYAFDKTVREIKDKLAHFIMSLNIDITGEQFAVLDVIYNSEDICASDVSKILAKDKSNVKRIVEILENKGLIKKIQGRKNNRLVNYLQISNDGKIFADKYISIVKNYMSEIFSEISDEEERLLRQIIIKLQK